MALSLIGNLASGTDMAGLQNLQTVAGMNHANDLQTLMQQAQFNPATKVAQIQADATNKAAQLGLLGTQAQVGGQQRVANINQRGNLAVTRQQGTTQLANTGLVNSGNLANIGLQNAGTLANTTQQGANTLANTGLQGTNALNLQGLQNTGTLANTAAQVAGTLANTGLQGQNQLGLQGLVNQGSLANIGAQSAGQLANTGLQNQGNLAVTSAQGLTARDVQALQNSGQLANTTQQGQNQLGVQGLINTGNLADIAAQSAGTLANTGLQGANTLANTGLLNEGNLDVTRAQGQTQLGVAGIGADASKFGATTSANANMYGADQARIAAGIAPGLQQARFNAVFPYLQSQIGQLGPGGALTPGGTSPPGQKISTAPVYSNDMIQQQVNAQRASNDRGMAQQQLGAQTHASGAGFGANSPLVAALQQSAANANLGANTSNEREIRLGSAAANSKQVLAAQQAREVQRANISQEDIARRTPYIQQQTALMASLAGLVSLAFIFIL